MTPARLLVAPDQLIGRRFEEQDLEIDLSGGERRQYFVAIGTGADDQRDALVRRSRAGRQLGDLRNQRRRKIVDDEPALIVERLSGGRSAGARQTRYENDFICFLTYDDEHHRLAIVSIPDLDDGRRSAGMEHVAFTYSDLDALLDTYQRLTAAGIEPVAPVNHGMTLSLYYADPDGNGVELQVDTMAEDEATAFMAGDVFAANPIGVSFDPADLVVRRQAGESVESLVAYVPQ